MYNTERTFGNLFFFRNFATFFDIASICDRWWYFYVCITQNNLSLETILQMFTIRKSIQWKQDPQNEKNAGY